MGRATRQSWARRSGAAAGLVLVVASFVVPAGPAVAATARSVRAAAPVDRVGGGGRAAPFEGTSKPKPGLGPYDSLDWAGWAVTGPPATSVTGSWTQPSVTCPGTKAEQSAFWVGIDGFAATDPTVQQIGTDADCTKGSKKLPGGPHDYAWYEMYPLPLQELNSTTYPVAPGSVLSASVVQSGTDYVLTISDSSGWTFSTTQPSATPAPLDSSAEWIAEAPLTCPTTAKCKPVPLADFGSVSFTGATVDGSAIDGSGLTDDVITMTKTKKGTDVEAATSALGPTGTSFTVTWLSI